MNRQTADKKVLFNFNPAVLVLFLVVSILPFTTFAQTTRVPMAADQIKDGQPIDIHSPQYTALFEELKSHYDFELDYLHTLFSPVTLHRRVLVLMDKQWEAKPYYKYWPIFINKSVIAKGKQKLLEHKKLFDRIEKELGVEREIVTAIWAIESKFGTYKGSYNVFRTLNTLFAAYPRRSEFFREELIHFLLLCRSNNIDPTTVKGSYAGAFGQTQFISSSYRRYAVDFDGDGTKDVFHSTDDVLASIANYLHNFGWQYGEPIYHNIGRKLHSEALIQAFNAGRQGRVGYQVIKTAQQVSLPKPYNDATLAIVGLERSPFKGGGMDYIAAYPNFVAITEWNHSNRYAMAVTQLAESFSE